MKTNTGTTSTKTKTAATTTDKKIPLQKFGAVPAETWEKYQAWCAARGSKGSAFFERVIADVINGQYINLWPLKPEAVVELERSADEQSTTVEHLVQRILAEWCSAKLSERKQSSGTANKRST